MEHAELYDLERDPDESLDLLAAGEADQDLVARLDQQLRRLVAQRRGRPDPVELDARTLEKLRAMGYVE